MDDIDIDFMDSVDEMEITESPLNIPKYPITPVKSTKSSAISEILKAPQRRTTQSILKQDQPINQFTEEPIKEVLQKHNKNFNTECQVTEDIKNPKQFVDSLQGKSGMYMISGDDYRQSPDVLMKIGKAKDLKNRLRQYFFCYPGGYYIYGVILTRKVPVVTKETSAHKTEQTIHAYLRRLNLNILQKHGKSGEWFLIQAPDVQKIFLIALSVASEMGLANPGPFCYAFFPPIFVKEYAIKTITTVRPPMKPEEAEKLEKKIRAEYRMTAQKPSLKGERQVRAGIARPYTETAKSLFS